VRAEGDGRRRTVRISALFEGGALGARQPGVSCSKRVGRNDPFRNAPSRGNAQVADSADYSVWAREDPPSLISRTQSNPFRAAAFRTRDRRWRGIRLSKQRSCLQCRPTQMAACHSRPCLDALRARSEGRDARHMIPENSLQQGALRTFCSPCRFAVHSGRGRARSRGGQRRTCSANVSNKWAMTARRDRGPAVASRKLAAHSGHSREPIQARSTRRSAKSRAGPRWARRHRRRSNSKLTLSRARNNHFRPGVKCTRDYTFFPSSREGGG